MKKAIDFTVWGTVTLAGVGAEVDLIHSHPAQLATPATCHPDVPGGDDIILYPGSQEAEKRKESLGRGTM